MSELTAPFNALKKLRVGTGVPGSTGSWLSHWSSTGPRAKSGLSR